VKAPAFWEAPLGAPALALAPLGLLYGLAAGARMRLVPGAHAGLPTLCVGNFTLGGAGKTPLAIAAVEALKLRGARPFVLSRGYGGDVVGPHLVDVTRDAASAVGDEPLMLASYAPVVVGADRVAAAAHARMLGAGCLVLDDGMQNPGLAKDVVIAVADGASGLGNGLVFPAGPLRAPMLFQWGAIDALAVMGDGRPGDALAAAARRRGKPVLRARLAPTPAARNLAGVGVVAFCGIGRPEKFRRTLEEVGARIAAFHAFPDHHLYAAEEIGPLVERACAEGLELVTTRKDHTRLRSEAATRTLARDVAPIDVAAVVEEPAALDDLITRVASGGASRGGA
jgi:tetraacyldisaccharide 4'-kinase